MNIVVYTTKTCAFCSMVKKFLTGKGLTFTAVDLDEQPHLRQDLLNRTGMMTVPIVQVNSEYVVGWNPAKLTEVINGAR